MNSADKSAFTESALTEDAVIRSEIIGLVRQYFDEDYYSELYPDLSILKGQGSDVLLKHFVDHGNNEGRQPNKWFERMLRFANRINGYSEITTICDMLISEPHEVAKLFHWAKTRQSIEKYFDQEYYRHTNGDVAAAEQATGIDLIIHYIEYGAEEGRDPTAWFDSDAYRKAYNLNIKTDNPFSHYIERNYETTEFLASEKKKIDILSKYFDRAWYIYRYEDVRLAAEITGIHPLYHYYMHGRHEGRRPNRWFGNKALRYYDPYLPSGDLITYIEEHRNQADAYLDAARKQNWDKGSLTYLALQPAFDAEFYLKRYGDLNEIANTSRFDALSHYIRYGDREGRQPNGWFDVNNYRTSGGLAPEENAFMHYLEHADDSIVHYYSTHGKDSLLPSPHYSQVSAEMPTNDMWNGFEELRDRGAESRHFTQPNIGEVRFTISLGGDDLREVCRGLNLTGGFKTPDVSIIIPCLNNALYTIECLSTISAGCGIEVAYEVLVIDNASQENLYEDISEISGLRYIRNETNLGFGRACNIGADLALAKTLIFLNNDAQVAPHSIRDLVNHLNSKNEIGITGPKILNFDGRLQEAGCVLNPDGSSKMVGYGRNGKEPRFSYPRKVDYISAVALAIRKSDFDYVGGFDDVFSPAYCEDVDLCLKIRKIGKSIHYVPSATVAHHLSRSSVYLGNAGAKNKLATRNQQKLVERWSQELSQDQVRLISFYLPQYHPIPENDLWWGKGFTEWRNVGKARPNYTGHKQPRSPADLGYYDLRCSQVMQEQFDLARRYGLSGFCYYYYWFNGRRVLEMPVERHLSLNKPTFPFCLCWANENWTKAWDGRENDVLMRQNYSDEDDLDVIKDIARHFASPDYIRINGKPLLLVYRVTEFPNFVRTSELWRSYCRRQGFGEIMLAMCESFELSARPVDPSTFGCDITVEFPPHGMVVDDPIKKPLYNPQFSGRIHDYKALASNYIMRDEPGFTRIRTVLAGWDNTPRRPNEGLILENACPGTFQAWLTWAIDRTREQNFGDERIVFVNAWNEWCEGSYLEPDSQYGHGYLQALKNALDYCK